MAETTDAYDADAMGAGDTVANDRVKHGNAAAVERPGGSGIERFGQGDRPCPMRAHLVGEATVPANDRRLRRRAMIVMT